MASGNRTKKLDLFTKITPVNAESVIRSIGKVWYALAAIQTAAYGLLADLDSVSIGNMIQPLFWLIGCAYFLCTRKSRSIAVILLLYAVASLAVVITLQIKFGSGAGGANFARILYCILAVFVAVGGVHATCVYHASIASKTIWKRVIGIYAATFLGAAMVVLVAYIAYSVAIKHRPEFSLPDGPLGDMTSGLTLLTAVAIMALLTRRYPFVSRLDAIADPLGGADLVRASPRQQRNGFS